MVRCHGGKRLIYCFLNRSATGWGRGATISLIPAYSAQQAGLHAVSTPPCQLSLRAGLNQCLAMGDDAGLVIFPSLRCLEYTKHNSHLLKEGKKSSLEKCSCCESFQEGPTTRSISCKSTERLCSGIEQLSFWHRNANTQLAKWGGKGVSTEVTHPASTAL